MATDRTPPNKRIARAESSAAEWKMKSIERREEIERLNLKIKDLESKIEKYGELANIISEQNKKFAGLEHELQKANQRIGDQQAEIENFKKKGRL